jgi:hypothetical protein
MDINQRIKELKKKKKTIVYNTYITTQYFIEYHGGTAQ